MLIPSAMSASPRLVVIRLAFSSSSLSARQEHPGSDGDHGGACQVPGDLPDSSG